MRDRHPGFRGCLRSRFQQALLFDFLKLFLPKTGEAQEKGGFD